jgi:1-aminocyclopropane-1-carboxylate deaminase
MLFSSAHSPCQHLPHSPLLGRALWIKRDDLLHPQVSGNKFRKLKYPFLALQGRQPLLVSMGGIWSNHIHALAYAAASQGWPSLALIRADANMNSAMLDDCRKVGMQVCRVTREEFRNLRSDSQRWQQHLSSAQLRADAVWLPEGGSAPLALRGVAELVTELPFVPDLIACACGTGATMAGLLAGMQGRGHVLAVAALKNAGYLHQEISSLLQLGGYPAYQNYDLLTDYHHGGYAKTSPALIDFCQQFELQHHIPLEPVYTGKLFFALADLQQRGLLAADKRLVAVHTGGLQGRRGFPQYPA